MKKVLFIFHSYHIGGITTSLYSLLSLLDNHKVESSIYAVSDSGEYKGKMPNCREIRANWRFSKSSEGLQGFYKLLHKVKRFIELCFRYIHIDIQPFIMRIADRKLRFSQYDAIICFSEALATYCYHIPSNNKIVWIHCDYSRHYANSDKAREKEAYKAFNRVICVSHYAKTTFDAIFPQYQDKSMYIHNVINIEDIQRRSKINITLSSQFDTSVYTIISAGRLDPVKGFDKIPSIAKEVKHISTLPFKWYIIGGGNQDIWNEIESEIMKNEVKDEVIMLGQQESIYSYLSQCNLYVSTSISESFPMVINEAKALSIPVVSHDFPSARESINEKTDGVICQYEDMALSIADMMNSSVNNTVTKIDNTKSLNQFYSII